MGILRFVMLGAIRAYQLVLRPVMPAGGCRFHPSCSEYAVDAIGRFGPVRGGWLALTRVLRCHPWGPAGIDPVPPPSGHVPGHAQGHVPGHVPGGRA